MKRTLLSIFSILVLTMAGSVMAQTDPGTADPAAATAPSSPSSETPALQQDAAGTEPGSAPSDPAAPPPSSDMGQAAAAPGATEPAPSESLPATASNAPLMTLIGAIAIAAFTVLLVVRKRRTAQS